MKTINKIDGQQAESNEENNSQSAAIPVSEISSEDIANNLQELDGPKYFITGAELLSRGVTSIPFLLDPILPRVGVGALGGSSDTGKSSLIRQLAMAVTLKEESFLNFTLKAEHGSVIYVSTEDDENALAYLMSKTNEAFRRKPNEYLGLKFMTESEDLYDRLKTILEKHKTDLIIMDVFTDLYANSMNESNQVRSYLNIYTELAKKHQCLIIFLHHCGKRTEEQPPSKNNLLGSQGFESKMRIVMELRADKDDPDKRHLCIVKGNYLPKELKDRSFVLDYTSMSFTNQGDRVRFEELGSKYHRPSPTEVMELSKSGKSQVEIAKFYGVKQSTISKWLKEASNIA